MKVYKNAGGLCALLVAVALSGCGGGGGASPVVGGAGGGNPPPNGIPNPGPANAATTYTVYSGSLGSQAVVEVVPLGQSAPAGLQGAKAAPGAIVVYPDGGTQMADTLGNFDASQSTWALANQNALAANPNLEPEVTVVVPSSTTPPAPADLSIVAYAPNSGQIVTAGAAVHVLGAVRASAAGNPADFAGVTVFPRGIAMFDNETRTFHAIGEDSNGSLVGLGSASVQWSVVTPPNCPAAAGKVTPASGDNGTATYTPPSAGTVPAGCQDEVVASISSGGTAYQASGNAFYYDPSQGVTLSGTLNNASGQPQGGAVVDLYGGGREFYHGNLFALTAGNGAYSRLVPANRTLYPVAGNISVQNNKPQIAYVAVNPPSIIVGGPGSTVSNETLTETSASFVNPFKPLPPIERGIRDAYYLGLIARESFPFGEPGTNGQFAANSIGAILGTPQANGAGTVQTGGYAGWTYAWDSNGAVATFLQPQSEEGGRHLLIVTVNAQYNGQPCASGYACFAFTRYYNPAGFTSANSQQSGTILAADGGWEQQVTGGAFNANLIRNDYSVGHQTQGQPLYTHQLAFQQQSGTANVTAADTWNNAAGLQIGALNVTRAAGTGSVLYTYSGTGKRLYYKRDGSTVEVDYAIGNGQQNNDRSGTFQITVTASPDAQDIGASVTWNENGASQILSSHDLAQGTVDNPNIPNLQTGHVASWVEDINWNVTVSEDPALGANTILFHL
ncbi:hypothetical protein EPN44_14465 [bacterium]|nr:MAG: hypothetical protein EPN44_14465 [bacterium]